MHGWPLAVRAAKPVCTDDKWAAARDNARGRDTGPNSTILTFETARVASKR